MQARAPNVLA
jgi:UMP-CMP kinase